MMERSGLTSSEKHVLGRHLPPRSTACRDVEGSAQAGAGLQQPRVG